VRIFDSDIFLVTGSRSFSATPSQPSITDNFFWASFRDLWPFSLENEENDHDGKKLLSRRYMRRETERKREREREREREPAEEERDEKTEKVAF